MVGTTLMLLLSCGGSEDSDSQSLPFPMGVYDASFLGSPPDDCDSATVTSYLNKGRFILQMEFLAFDSGIQMAWTREGGFGLPVHLPYGQGAFIPLSCGETTCEMEWTPEGITSINWWWSETCEVTYAAGDWRGVLSLDGPPYPWDLRLATTLLEARGDCTAAPPPDSCEILVPMTISPLP